MVLGISLKDKKCSLINVAKQIIDAFICLEISPWKVHFRDKDENLGSDMLVDLTVEQTISWKDKLVGHSSNAAANGLEEKEDFDLLEGGI
ncbi:hypothetical protein PVK06_035743 [Gossypium arboreum]|uniref:Uncharacterized protein n=1 Tax=Gossypium arboreum TaxID=29729 RepID=A0ABR0NHL1_GOSAR|nr:hypothetical protein PVK06_035743 [Gossypium arboreum]